VLLIQVIFLEKLMVTLISGRTSNQGVGLEEGKTSEKYIQSVQYVEINPKDAEKLNIKEGDTVKLATNVGEVIVNWKPDERLDQGLVFFPYGIWANQLYNSFTYGTGMPSFKGIKAKLSLSKSKQTTSLEEILNKMRSEKR
jgi:formylmethanofuran dehydrogenase subunit D